MWKVINFYYRYLFSKWRRFDRFMMDEIEINRVRNNSSPEELGFGEDQILEFNQYLDNQIEEARQYWRV